MKKVQQGFTLIELMIVVAIIGILAAIAIPAYNDYTGRAQVSEAVELLGGLKTPLAEFYHENGAFPTSLGSLGTIVTGGKYVNGMAINGTAGTVTSTFKTAGVNAGISGTTIVLSYATATNKWTCGPGTTPTQYVPKACQ